MTKSKKLWQWHGYPARAGLLLVLLSLLLAACGDTPPVGPPPTPTPNYRQETNQDLFFVMSVPINWAKTASTDTVTFTSPEDANVKLSINSVKATTPLTPDSTRILQERLDALKARFPQLKQDNAGLLRLVDSSVPIFKVTYTENNLEISEYLAEVNAPLAARAYILSGRTPAASAEQRRPVFFASFDSFRSNAPLVVSATQTAVSSGDPTILAAGSEGKVSGDKPSPGKAVTLVDWQSPPLLYGPDRFTIGGLLPQDWQWRIRSFPTLDKAATTVTPAGGLANPGLYFNAPNNEAFIQLGIVPNVFATNAPPTGEEYNRAIDPYLKSFNQSLVSLGSRNSIGTLDNVGTFYRTSFIARNEAGATNARGVVLFRSAGRHLVMGVITLGPQASLKPTLVDSYENDIQTIVSSVRVAP